LDASDAQHMTMGAINAVTPLEHELLSGTPLARGHWRDGRNSTVAWQSAPH